MKSLRPMKPHPTQRILKPLILMFTNYSSYTAIALRNYMIAALTVLSVSVGIGELFNQPSRLATQNTIDTYTSYLSAGLVSHAQSSLK
ncbi:MAG: hypothetical protein RLZZ568_2210 [Cyanobacteriota bacterium]